MTNIIQFQGNIPINIYNNITLDTHSRVTVLDFGSKILNWNSTYVPSELNGTLNNVVSYLKSNSNIFSYNFSYNVKITGHQGGGVRGQPGTDILFCPNDCTNQYDYYSAGQSADDYLDKNHQDEYVVENDTYDVDSPVTNLNYNGIDYSSQYPAAIAIYPHQVNCSDCSSHNPANYSFTLTLQLNVTLNCTGSLLDNPVCNSYCLQNANLSQCKPFELSYCFPSGTPSSNMPVATSSACQNYMQAYINSNGPDSEIDTALNTYCQGKYSDLNDLFTNGSPIDQSMCACHMQPEQYKNFQNSLAAQFSAAGFVIGQMNAECLLPQCATSPYKSITTGAKCQLPLLKT